MSGALVVVALVAFGVAAGLTEPLRRVALRVGLTDRPARHKAHRAPTPYLGGVAIAAGLLVPVVVGLGRLGAPRPLVVALGAAGVIAILGLLDDARGLSARFRVAVEALLAAAVVSAGARLEIVAPLWLDAVLTIGWIVVLTNAYNLLDNSDGALATIAATTAVPLAVTAARGGQASLALVFIGLAAACVGFLAHNWPPARIFMGDSGSLFLGFVIATGVLLIRPSGVGLGHTAALMLVVFVPLVDTTLVVLARRRAGRPIYRGGTDHVAHRLRRCGLPAYAVLVTLVLAATGAGMLAALAREGLAPGPATLAGVLAALATLVALLLRVPDAPRVAVPHPPVTAAPLTATAPVPATTIDRRASRHSGITT